MPTSLAHLPDDLLYNIAENFYRNSCLTSVRNWRHAPESILEAPQDLANLHPITADLRALHAVNRRMRTFVNDYFLLRTLLVGSLPKLLVAVQIGDDDAKTEPDVTKRIGRQVMSLLVWDGVGKGCTAWIQDQAPSLSRLLFHTSALSTLHIACPVTINKECLTALAQCTSLKTLWLSCALDAEFAKLRVLALRNLTLEWAHFHFFPGHGSHAEPLADFHPLHDLFLGQSRRTLRYLTLRDEDQGRGYSRYNPDRILYYHFSYFVRDDVIFDRLEELHIFNIIIADCWMAGTSPRFPALHTLTLRKPQMVELPRPLKAGQFPKLRRLLATRFAFDVRRHTGRASGL